LTYAWDPVASLSLANSVETPYPTYRRHQGDLIGVIKRVREVRI